MSFELVADTVKMGFIVFCLYAVFRMVQRGLQPTQPLQRRRRVAGLAALALALLALEVTEDVLGGKSGPIDNASLVFVHAHAPAAMTPFFEMLTYSGSALFLTPGVAAVSLLLWWRRHHHEALLLAASPLLGAAVVYIVKTLVGRARPDLWPSTWYSGSSFPSGHTLGVAATATAAAIVLTRLWPASHRWAVGAAFVWTALMALSRLVLGVHWPTDVLAAASIGAAIPLVLSLGLAGRRL